MWYQTSILGHEDRHAVVEQVEEMLSTTCHIVIKALVKFTHISLHHDGCIRVRNFGPLYNFSDFF